MAYRNGTYVAFHAKGTANQSQSDIKFYRTLQMWDSNAASDFSFINSHDKTAAVRDTSLRATLRSRLQERLRNSRNLLLITTADTKLDTDWVPFEISQAIDWYKLPIIAAYPDFDAITVPEALRPLWPTSLATRIGSGIAKVVHIPFRQAVLLDAIEQFGVDHLPPGGLSHYTVKAQEDWGYL